jgi:transcriptional regulator with XRE-family HTH domain
MVGINGKISLEALGRRLKEVRLEKDDTQQEFASRVGISVPTLRKMEKGDPHVSIGLWIEALWLLDRLSDLDQVLAPRESLFDQYEKTTKLKRQRASKRKHDD